MIKNVGRIILIRIIGTGNNLFDVVYILGLGCSQGAFGMLYYAKKNISNAIITLSYS